LLPYIVFNIFHAASQTFIFKLSSDISTSTPVAASDKLQLRDVSSEQVAERIRTAVDAFIEESGCYRGGDEKGKKTEKLSRDPSIAPEVLVKKSKKK
jgi:hypothetical protein